MSRSSKAATLVILGILGLAAIAVTLVITTSRDSSTAQPWSNFTGESKPSPFEAAITMSITLGTYSKCGSGGYADIREGTQVEIVNQKNEILALGKLHRDTGECAFKASVKDIPPGEKMYGAKLGNANRGVVWMNEDEAKTAGWALVLGE